MAFSTFVFDTLDVAARLGRYILQELFGWSSRRGVVLATLLTLTLPVAVLWLAEEGSWIQFWTLFGASNQLMAALTLLAVSLWLLKSKRNIWFTILPMCFVLMMTLWALGRIFWGSWAASSQSVLMTINSFVALTLILLALFLLWQGYKEFRRCR